MATLSQSESRRLYSWWWDSHISPKNSKWLQDNLTDMDTKVKAMIKLIEEDADSFARRAEMYYKKRPELMKLVEEFYRAYRALAERYDHATGELRQAHRTMAEAFPNQVPYSLTDDSQSCCSGPDVELFDPEDLQKGVLGISSMLNSLKYGAEEETDSETIRKGLKQLKEVFSSPVMVADDGLDTNLDGFAIENPTRELSDIEAEKEARVLQYMQCLEIISALENKITLTDSRLHNEQTEMKSLKEELSKLKEEKEISGCRNEECLEKIAKLESEISHTVRLNSEIRENDEKIQSEVDILAQKIAIKDREVLEKENELEKLHLLMENERTRFEQVEATLETLKNLHMKSQEEIQLLASELRNKLEMVTDLENGIQRVSEENKNLQELNNSSTVTLKEEVSSLNDLKEKLEHEVSVQMNRSNGLQEEVSRLKEEIESLNNRYRTLMEKIQSTGLNPERFESSVKELQDQNSNLITVSKNHIDEKNALHEKLRDIEISLSNEKSTFFSHFRILTENMQKLSETNTILENSLSAANIEIEELRTKSRSLEELIRFMKNEKYDLINERNALISKLESVEERVGILETRFTRLECKYDDLEKEKDSALVQVEQLRSYVGEERIEQLSYALSTESRWAELNNHVYVLREECMSTKREFEEEVDKAVNAQVEIFVLKKFIEDLEEKNMLIMVEFQKQSEGSKRSDKLISELETENLEQQVELEVLLDEISEKRNKMCVLEEENDVMIEEAIAFSCRSLVFERFAVENAKKLEEIEEDRDNRKVMIETLSKKLDVKEAELTVNIELNDELRYRIQIGEDFLRQKGIEISKTEQKLEAMDNMNADLQTTIENLKTECEESKRIGHDFEKHVLNLSEISVKQREEIEYLNEANKDLESEIEEGRIREEQLSIELQEKNKEFEVWDVEAASFFFDLQISSIREVLLEDKVQELTVVCENFEEENVTKNAEVEYMKERVSYLESENCGMKIQLSCYVPVIASLKDSIESLEQSIIPRRNLSPAAYVKQTGDERDGGQHNEDRYVAATDETTRLRDMEARIKAIEMAVIRERNRLARKKILAGSADVEVLVRKRSENEVPTEEIENGASDKQRHHRKTKSEISDVKNVLTMKDIPLDRASNSFRNGSKREKGRSGELGLGLGLWESTERDCSIEFTTNNDGENDGNGTGTLTMRRKQFNDVKHKRRVPSSDLQLELSVDKLAVSSTSIKAQNHDENKENVLKRIVSDNRKLTNLQTSVRNLKSRTISDTMNKSKKSSNLEYEEVKLHLQEVEETITQRIDMNRKLVKDMEEKGDTDRKMVTEGSEMIGRLQFEVQSAEYVLQKLEDEPKTKPKPKSRVAGARTGFMLRNFIFKHDGNTKRRKKACFCGCARSSTSDS